MISVIDYGVGNLRSVEKALQFIGCNAVTTSVPEEVLKSDGIVLPGVGAFRDAMENLCGTGMADAVKEALKKGKPFLGICLGMQLLFEFSEEGSCEQETAVRNCSSERLRLAEGLKIFMGSVRRFPKLEGIKIPHMGWSSIEVKKGSVLFAGLGEKPCVYFVHSYYVSAADRNIPSAGCNYGIDFDAAVEEENISAVQFHPEKSGSTGLKILRNWADRYGF